MAAPTHSNDCSHIFLTIACNQTTTLPKTITEQLDTFSTVVFSLMLIAIIVGLLGNVLVTYVVFAKPNMKTVHNVYLVNLAVLDILFLGICAVVDNIGCGYIAFRDEQFNVSHHVYASTIFVHVVTFTASCGILMSLAGDRFLAIVHPLENKKRRTMKNTLIAQAIVWTVSILAGIIASVLESSYMSHIIAEAYILYEMTFSYLVLIVFLSCCYGAILYSVREHEKVEGDRVARWQLRRNIQMLRMVTVLVLIFLLCRGFWLIYGFLVHYHLHTANVRTYSDVVVQLLARLTCIFNSAVNPFVYAAFTSDFRTHLTQVICHPFSAASKPQRRGTYDASRRSIVMSSSVSETKQLDKSYTTE